MASTLIPLSGAALTTAAVMYPVDVVRALKMAHANSTIPFSISNFYKQYGVKGFVSQGVLPELLKSTTMRVSKFFFFPILCTSIFNKQPSELPAYKKAVAGALATIPEILMISPMEVAKIGLQTDSSNQFKNSSSLFLRHLRDTRGGYHSWYVGWAGMQWRQSWWTGLFFATLADFKRLVEPTVTAWGGGQAVANVLSGFAAGVFASIPNAPGDVVRSVVQKKLFDDPKRPAYGVGFNSVVEHAKVASEIVRARGFTGLYAGFQFKALHLGGSGALMAMLVPIFAQLTGIKYTGV